MRFMQWDLSLKCKGGSTYENQSLWWATLIEWRIQNHMISVDQKKKKNDKIQHSFMLKALNTLE